MKTFIKVIEIWLPNRERTHLEFGSGLYGPLTEFKSASTQQQFAYNEGLPGKAWAQAQPLVLTRFEQSYFKRTVAAQKAGLTCAIAIPIFSGEYLLAVVVFLCGDDAEHAGAIEVWSTQPDSIDNLHLLDGYYGSLQEFEQISRSSRLNIGSGIPGLVWESGKPVLLDDISSCGFQRANAAAQAGITTGLGIPLINMSGHTYIITFLSAKSTPIAKRIQLWIPDHDGEHLLCQQGYSKQSNDLAEIFEAHTVTKGEGALGRVWLTGLPIITGSQMNSYNPELDNLSSMLAIPVITLGRLQAIVTFLF